MNYEETFAIVAKMTIIRAIITVTFVCQWFSYEIILLNGELKEKVYMVLVFIKILEKFVNSKRHYMVSNKP